MVGSVGSVGSVVPVYRIGESGARGLDRTVQRAAAAQAGQAHRIAVPQPINTASAKERPSLRCCAVDHTYRVTEIVGTSTDGIEQAVRNGVTRASKTLRNLDWFEVTEVRGQINDGDVAYFQVGLKVGFRLEEA